MPRKLSQIEAKKVMQDARLKPIGKYPGAQTPWDSICQICGSRARQSLSNVRNGFRGCKTCAQEARNKSSKLRDSEVRRLLKNSGFEQLGVYVSSITPIKVRCIKCKKISSPTVNNIKRGSHCKYCTNHAIDPKDAVKTMLKKKIKPLSPFKDAHSAWPSECMKCKKKISPSYKAIASGGGCRYCNDTKIRPEEAEKLMLAQGLQPIGPYPGANGNWRCICIDCGLEFKKPFSHVKYAGGGCPSCAKYGYNPAKSAVVYLVVNERLGAVKVGIANTTSPRLKHHVQDGWTVDLLVKTTGKRARVIEERILDWWRGDLQLPYGAKKSQMQHGGFTETAPLKEVDMAGTRRRIKKLSKSR